MSDQFITGTVKLVNLEKRFGFVAADDAAAGERDHYFRLRGPAESLFRGARVRFKSVPSAQGRAAAVDVERLDPVGPAQGEPHPQQAMIDDMRAESCVNPHVPIAWPRVPWPVVGPTTAQYYAEKHRKKAA